MLKKMLVVSVLSLGVFTLIGCNSGSGTTAVKTSERTQYVGHLDGFTDKAVTLRNPKNGHVKTFAVNDKTVYEVDGAKATKLPGVVKGDSKNCRVTVTPGTDNATKVEVKTKL